MNISVTLMGQLSRDKVSPDKLLVTSRLIFSVNRNEQEKQLSQSLIKVIFIGYLPSKISYLEGYHLSAKIK